MSNLYVFASRNINKIKEIESLVPLNIQLLGLQEINCYEDLPETHDTIEENSKEKALYVAEKYEVNCIAEDSGLEVNALNGEPGVHSAHYSGSRDANKNIALVLDKLRNEKNRVANFKTVFTLITDGEILQFTGIVTGEIHTSATGINGFGYDPIFIPNGYNITFGEMSPVDKASISHRTKAFTLLKHYLELKFKN